MPGIQSRDRSTHIVKKLKTFLHKSSQLDQNSDQPIDFSVDCVLTVCSRGGIEGNTRSAVSQATEERRKQIMAQLLDRKHLTVKELAASMHVSGATVRRDLKALAGEEELLLVHGGATLPRQGDFSFRAKQLRAVEQKRIIGRLAAALLLDGDQVFLDAGTTCSEMVPYLKKMQGVTVLTNSARLALAVKCAGAQRVPDRWRISPRPDGHRWPDGDEHAESGARLCGVHWRGRFEHGFRPVGQRCRQRASASACR